MWRWLLSTPAMPWRARSRWLPSPKSWTTWTEFPQVKAAAAIGLLSVTRFPALARLTTAMLTLYFVLAVGAHIRARDKVVNAIPAASFLATFAVMTVKGPDRT